MSEEGTALEEIITIICRHYNYRLDDFYIKSFLQGGLTFLQTLGLYESYLEEEESTLRFQAALHGVKLKGTKQNDVSSKDNLEKAVPMFGDPKDYENLSQEEREKLTKKMMGKHKIWAGTAFEGSHF